MRQEIFKKYMKQFFTDAIAAGFSIAIWWDRYEQGYEGTNLSDLIEDCFAADECDVRLKRGKELEWALIVLDVSYPEEMIADYTVGGFIEKWCSKNDN